MALFIYSYSDLLRFDTYFVRSEFLAEVFIYCDDDLFATLTEVKQR